MNKSLITTLLLCFACLVAGFFGCADSSVTLEKDVEYRTGNPGSIPLLYKIEIPNPLDRASLPGSLVIMITEKRSSSSPFTMVCDTVRSCSGTATE